jgi:hypothetical protein
MKHLSIKALVSNLSYKIKRRREIGHSLHGMDDRYLAPSAEDLHRQMAFYTSWLDAQFANAGQNASQEAQKVSQNRLTH